MPKKKVYVQNRAYNRQTRTMATEPNTLNPVHEGRRLNLLKFDATICEKFDHKIMDAHTWLHKFLPIARYYKWTNESSVYTLTCIYCPLQRVKLWGMLFNKVCTLLCKRYLQNLKFCLKNGAKQQSQSTVTYRS